MPTQITLEMPAEAAKLIADDPERFKTWAAENGFDVTSVEVRQPSVRTEFGSARTACSCANCSINCRFIPGYLIPADLERIAAHVGAENVMAFAAENLLASSGAIVGTTDGQRHRIPTLVPARHSNGACKFLAANGNCSIHAVSPFGCAFFDTHQSLEESDSLSMQGLMAIDREWQQPDDSVYAAIWIVLNEAGLTAPAPMVARAKMAAAMAVAANQ